MYKQTQFKYRANMAAIECLKFFFNSPNFVSRNTFIELMSPSCKRNLKVEYRFYEMAAIAQHILMVT